MEKNKILAGIVLVGIIAVIIAFITTNQPQTKITETTTTTTAQLIESNIAAGEGDIVEVNYIGSFINGTIFDTSYKDVAIENNIYDPARRYPPLKFKVGAGQVISGFDDAVIGMKIGEEKTVKIPPTLGYGRWDPKLVEYVNRTQKSPRIQNVTLEKFLSVVGKQPDAGMNFTIPEISWPITVMGVRNNTVTIMHNPSGNEILETILGNATVGFTDKEIIITVNPGVGMNYNGLRVIGVNETTITVDMNHELAGKTLIFKIKVENIRKGDSS